MGEELATVYNNFASATKKGGDAHKAIPMYRRALELQNNVQEAKGGGGESMAPIMINLGSALMATRQYDEAGEVLEKAYQLRLAAFGEDHKNTKSAAKWLEKLERLRTGEPEGSLEGSMVSNQTAEGGSRRGSVI